jgi:hypothetical protein
LPGLAQAVEYKTVLADKSAINFTFKQMNVGMDGHFKKFSTQLAFDPANAANAKVSLDVDLASIDTGTSDGNDRSRRQAVVQHQGFPDGQVCFELGQGARRQSLRSRRPADDQGQDAAGRRADDGDRAGRPGDVRRQLRHQAR